MADIVRTERAFCQREVMGGARCRLKGTMALIDSHAHLDFYTDDLNEVLDRAEAAGVTGLLAIGIGDGPATMHRALDIAQAKQRPGLTIWASAGIHPQETEQATPEWLAKLAELAAR